MGNVAIKLKIMPVSLETDLNKIKKDIEKKMKVHDSKIEEIGFGLKCLKILVITPDAGGTDEIENQIKKIKGVETVEVESVTLV